MAENRSAAGVVSPWFLNPPCRDDAGRWAVEQWRKIQWDEILSSSIGDEAMKFLDQVNYERIRIPW